MAALHDDSSKVVCTEAQWNLVRVFPVKQYLHFGGLHAYYAQRQTYSDKPVNLWPPIVDYYLISKNLEY